MLLDETVAPGVDPHTSVLLKRSQRSQRSKSKVNERGDLLTDRSSHTFAPRKTTKGPSPNGAHLTGAALISGPILPKARAGKRRSASQALTASSMMMSSAQAALLAPPESSSSSALQAAQHASKLQAELTALLHAADEAAAQSNTRLVILKAEAAAQDKRHAEELKKAFEAGESHARDEVRRSALALEAAQGDLAASRADLASLRAALEKKEEEYAEELQRWVVDLNEANERKLREAASGEKARVASAVEAATRKEEAKWAAKVADLEARLRAVGAAPAESGGSRGEAQDESVLEC